VDLEHVLQIEVQRIVVDLGESFSKPADDPALTAIEQVKSLVKLFDRDFRGRLVSALQFHVQSSTWH
jgi:hypothetical protein